MKIRNIIKATLVSFMILGFLPVFTTSVTAADLPKGHKITLEVMKAWEHDIIHVGRFTGTWPSLTVAQALLEQGGSESSANWAKKYNNFWGIKWSESFATKYPGSKPVGASTTECTGNGSNCSGHNLDFTHFAGLHQSFLEHSVIWTNGSYTTSSVHKDPQHKHKSVVAVLSDFNSTVDDFYQAVAWSAYASTGAEGYYERLKYFYNKYGLSELDKKAFPNGRTGWGKYNKPIKGSFKPAGDQYDKPKNSPVSGAGSGGWNGAPMAGGTNPNPSASGGTGLGGFNGDLNTPDDKLIGMPPQWTPPSGAPIEMPDGSKLSASEQKNIQEWGDSMDYQSKQRYNQYLRTGAMFLGIVTVFWAFVVLLAILVDMSLPATQGKAMKFATLGRFTYCSEVELNGKTPKGSLNTKSVLIISVSLLVIGAFLVTGVLTSALIRLFEYIGS